MMIDSQVARFGGLVLGLSIPFYAVGALTAGGHDVVALPVSALAVVVPVSAAALVTRHSGGSVRELLASGVRPARFHPVRWLALAVGVMPIVVLATHALLVPRDPESSGITLPATGAFVVMALAGAWCEETGWAAFASRRLLERHSVLATGLLVGAFWGVWHLIPFVQTNHSWNWVWAQTAFTVAFRLLITSMVAASGSTLTAVLLHASYNVAWTLLPTIWSSYDPVVLAPVTAAVAIALTVACGRSRRLGSVRRVIGATT